ncbi:hypothetical protein U9M48_029272 [Paspalum notatum var. saurae]|uniref:Uncharacterized protein n=1 Tax=Paspalum notatum var. saurae TaxID=547442 RepID=A0AAQ3TZ41_PASNO
MAFSSSSSSVSLSPAAAPTRAPDTAGAPRQSKRTLPLGGVRDPSDAAPPVFSRLPVLSVVVVPPAAAAAAAASAASGAALRDADQNGTLDESVRAISDGHRSNRALLLPPRDPGPVRRRLSSPAAAATISLRTCSGSRSVNRSRSPVPPSTRGAAREWPVERDRGTTRSDRDRHRTARRWLPIRSSSAASLLSSSAPPWLTSMSTTWSRCSSASPVLLLPLPTSSPEPAAAGSSSSSGSRLQRQTGHVTWPASHSPMQSVWNAWLQAGSSRSSSSSPNSLRQTAHSSAASLPPTRSAFASAYRMVGNAATTAGSSPRCRWLRCSCRARTSSAAAEITGPPGSAARPHRRMYTEKKPMKRKPAMSATRSTTIGALKPPGDDCGGMSRDGACAAAGAPSSSKSSGSTPWWRGVVMWRWWAGGVSWTKSRARARGCAYKTSESRRGGNGRGGRGV